MSIVPIEADLSDEEKERRRLYEKYGLAPQLPEVFDDHFSGTYEDCNRMAYYQVILGRRPSYDDRYALLWGTVFHKIAETWVQNPELQAILDIIDANIPPDVDDYYGRTQRRMQEAFFEWAKFRQQNPLTIIKTEQAAVVHCQSPCMYNPGPKGCNLLYGGKLDTIVRWNNLVGPLDYKTTTQGEDDPVAEYSPSHQMMGYTWLTGHLLGQHCWGVIVERMIINKSNIKPGRFPVSYSRDQIMEWVENERRIQKEIRAKFTDHAYDELAWTQNYKRCYAPQRRCAFRDVCLSARSGNFRYKWLRDNTTEDRFDFQKAMKEGK